MAVTDNLKMAAASIRKAADDMKREIDALRRDLDKAKRNKEIAITAVNIDIASRQTELARASDTNEKQQKQQELGDMNTRVARLRLELKQDQDNLQAAIKAKESALAGLENQARAIDSQAGTTGLL